MLMRKKALMILLNEASVAAGHDIAGQAQHGRLASAMSGEGYAGGYRQAISDVLLALSDAPPSNSRYWPTWARQCQVTETRARPTGGGNG
jgi:hypothetical protein